MSQSQTSDNQNYKNRAANRLQEILNKKTDKPQTQSWMVVYLDVITLLLATFILLVNQPQQEFLVKEPELKQEKLQQEPVEAPVTDFTDTLSNQLAESQTPSPELKTNVAEEILKQLELIKGDELLINVQPGNISLQLPEAILFETGNSRLLTGADELLDKIAPVLLQRDLPVSVEGHTDNVPISSPLFPSNWELSAARASTVIRKLGELGVPYTRMKAIGYADTIPIDSNDTEDGRRRNRRVNIVIHAASE